MPPPVSLIHPLPAHTSLTLLQHSHGTSSSRYNSNHLHCASSDAESACAWARQDGMDLLDPQTTAPAATLNKIPGQSNLKASYMSMLSQSKRKLKVTPRDRAPSLCAANAEDCSQWWFASVSSSLQLTTPALRR